MLNCTGEGHRRRPWIPEPYWGGPQEATLDPFAVQGRASGGDLGCLTLLGRATEGELALFGRASGGDPGFLRFIGEGLRMRPLRENLRRRPWIHEPYWEALRSRPWIP